MYIPKHFEVTDRDTVFSFIEANAFGQLVSNVDERFFSTHLPFLVSRDRTKLIGHLARENPQHLELEDREVLVTFQGPHGYVSPSWYNGPGVPTWNYQAAHVYGKCTTFQEVEKLGTVVDALAKKYESAFHEPWEPDYNPGMLQSIVGFEVEIRDIQCKYKLSQNRSGEDQTRIIAQLRAAGSSELADTMERITSD